MIYSDKKIELLEQNLKGHNANIHQKSYEEKDSKMKIFQDSKCLWNTVID